MVKERTRKTFDILGIFLVKMDLMTVKGKGREPEEGGTRRFIGKGKVVNREICY